MLQLKNDTGFAANIFISPDVDGVDSVFTIVKGTFTLGGRMAVAEEQVPVALASKHYGDPLRTSVSVPSDVCLTKPSTDVLLIGSAWAPEGRPTWQMDVSLSVGPLTKTARVSGDRVWDGGPTGAAVSWVAPFERMPLVWERAFGGSDETDNGPAADPRNPVGVGFRGPGSGRTPTGKPLPNLEDPARLISSWKDAPQPAGFAPLAAHWEPRRSYAGTYDAAWERQRAPYLPADFSPWFFQIAPPGLVAPGYLQGGEPVEVRGATPAGVLRFQLPRVCISVTYVLDNAPQSRPANLDTVIIEPDAGRLVLVWRAQLRCDKKALRVNEIRASTVGAGSLT